MPTPPGGFEMAYQLRVFPRKKKRIMRTGKDMPTSLLPIAALSGVQIFSGPPSRAGNAAEIFHLP